MDQITGIERHEFPVRSAWAGNSDGDGTLETPWGASVAYGVPTGTGGKPGRSNPEELLTAAVVSCYSITLALLIEKRRLPAFPIEVAATGAVERQPDRRLKFTDIGLRPRVTVPDDDPALRESLTALMHKAEDICLVSAALRAAVRITVEPEIVTG